MTRSKKKKVTSKKTPKEDLCIYNKCKGYWDLGVTLCSECYREGIIFNNINELKNVIGLLDDFRMEILFMNNGTEENNRNLVKKDERDTLKRIYEAITILQKISYQGDFELTLQRQKRENVK